MLPEVQQAAKIVMGVLDDETLQALLDTLAVVGASVEQVPEDLTPPEPRHTPARLRRAGSR